MNPVLVSALALTPVKGTRLQPVTEIELERDGARGNRLFYVTDERDRMVNAKGLGGLQTIVSHCDDGRLRLSFADGSVVEDRIELGEPVTTRFFSQAREARPVLGRFSDAISEHLGRPLRLMAAPAVDRGRIGGASLISRASLQTLAEMAGESSVDARRFRMLVEVDGLGAHEEDSWVGRSARVGAAVVRWNGHVGRCLITSRHPETGDVDLPTLDILGDYRRGAHTTEPLPFGIYGEVVEPGVVRIGDAVELVQ